MNMRFEFSTNSGRKRVQTEHGGASTSKTNVAFFRRSHSVQFERNSNGQRRVAESVFDFKAEELQQALQVIRSCRRLRISRADGRRAIRLKTKMSDRVGRIGQWASAYGVLLESLVEHASKLVALFLESGRI